MSFISEFKAFAMRGNVIDLAVAVVIGAAFNKIITASVDGIIMPSLGILLGGIDLTTKSLMIGHTVFKWGLLLQSIIDFTLISLVIFCVIKFMNTFFSVHARLTPKSNELQLLTQIRDLLKQDINLKSNNANAGENETG